MKVFKFLGGAWLFIVLFGGMSFAAEPIKIGYIATLTGEGATWGQHERDGALLAVKDINAKGGVLGRPLELVCYDIKGKPEEAVIAVRRLMYEDKVAAVGGSNYSGIQIAVAPIADKAQVPIVSSTASNLAVTVDPDTGKVRPYMFRISYTDPYQGMVIADYLIKKCGAKKLAILGDIGDAYSEGLTEYVKKRADELGVENRFWAYRGGDVDFRAQLTAAKEWGSGCGCPDDALQRDGAGHQTGCRARLETVFYGGQRLQPQHVRDSGGSNGGNLLGLSGECR